MDRSAMRGCRCRSSLGPAGFFARALGAARGTPKFWAPGDPVWGVRISLLSGRPTDLTTPAARRWLGSELAFPDLLATRLMASAGYFQEGGWTRGHTGWIQVILRSHLAFRILTRVSWFRSTGRLSACGSRRSDGLH